MINIKNKKDYNGKGEYIGRPSVLGNPYCHYSKSIAEFKTNSLQESLDEYYKWICKRLADNDIVIKEFNRLVEIYKNTGELNLICWCYPKQCHGNIIKDLILDTIDQNRPIDRFIGHYRFLSNFYPCEIEWCGIKYPASENAYQASKFDDNDIKLKFGTISPYECYKIKKTLKPREGWDREKLDIMYLILRKKFFLPKFRELLISTGDREIIESNTWHDVYWGVCDGVGENNLGKLLMKIREEIRPI